MSAIAIRYLNGWAMAAADGAKKELAEWPPHPDRVFMALAAAWFETGEDADEGAALRWLEDQYPPAIAASDVDRREVLTNFVPVNDTRASKAKPAGSDLGNLKDRGLDLLPEFRSRQPRSFPVAIPHDPIVHFIWMDCLPPEHKTALERLLTKVTHVGHSASLVQAWIADHAPAPRWKPANGLTKHRLRVPHTGRLDSLKQQLNRDDFLAFHDLLGEIGDIKEALKAIKAAQPQRTDWEGFPDVLILKEESAVKGHPLFPDAKRGNPAAAAAMLKDLLSLDDLERIRQLARTCPVENKPVLAAVHAWEKGLNAIPSALADWLGDEIGCTHEDQIVQTNVVWHTGADGYSRLARQALFDGPVEKGRSYILVDDFVGQGGTLANLKGYISSKGGHVAAAVVLTGKRYSAKLSLSESTLHELRRTHGADLERWWKDRFGHSFDRLTESEARYLARSPDADRIRDRIVAAERQGNSSRHEASPKEQRQRLKQLEAELKDRFPNGTPPSQRPAIGLWRGYGPVETPDVTETSPNHFDPNLIVLRMSGKGITLPGTFRLTGALRGALLKFCPMQPPPEWLTGHTSDGRPSRKPHLALLPLPFVGSEHADGRILGIALALPRELEERGVADCLTQFLYDETGLTVVRRLFDGEWLECEVEQETREQPPLALCAERWTRRSRTWASVTPVVLDRHYDGKDRWQRAAEDVKKACERIGLPAPKEVMLHPVSLAEGVPHARKFPCMTRKSDGGIRNHSHAVLVFDQPVAGPVMIGAGRFRGYGMCLPMDQGKQSND
ncbi:MAG: type I-U CRISPR-associated protein Csb2 [Gammaproteobacteria bacterium]|nr:type I-U CRISPR-associated protein Csb2 [Gammaproteobacteria bacterium]